MIMPWGFPVLWIGPHGPTDPELPPGSLTCTASEVATWLVQPRCEPLEALRRSGADAVCSADADREIKRFVRAAHAYLMPRRMSVLAAFADELALPALGEHLRKWPIGTPLTLATLAETYRRVPYDETSRLLLALENL